MLINEKFKCTGFYNDKSLLIKDFLEDDSDNICVTRPSKYGKTTNLIMMREFFQMNYENKKNLENRNIFEKLNIGKEFKIINGEKVSYIDIYLGKYPVIFLDFNELKIGSCFEETINNFKYFIQNLYESYQNIKIESLSNIKKKKWNNFIECNTNNDNLIDSISFLCSCLNKLFNQKIVLLIDNYDLPILNTFNTNFYDEFYSFYKNVLMSIFNNDKNNYYLFKTFVTGKFCFSFLDTSTLTNYSLRQYKYSEYFTITESELRKLLSELKLIINLMNLNIIVIIYIYLKTQLLSIIQIFLLHHYSLLLLLLI